ncbi:hypothetical protein [Yoonia sp. BS5-3]|uniref:Uncharacterized protein n=1 Tax=Yoonia phaeophyticola TaxID=3137369 RepID=A0ABZ2VAI0_9RHOB
MQNKPKLGAGMNTETKIKAVTAMIAVIGLIAGIFQFIHVQSIAAATPFLQKKLLWCEEAVDTAARIATSETPEQPDLQRFWQLYWGKMGLIENETVKAAMIRFGASLTALDLSYQSPDAANSDDAKAFAPENVIANASEDSLQDQSLALAHACRDELSREWSARWTRS